MISLIQRVTRASVTVAGEAVGAIDSGLLALVAVQRGDGEAQVRRMAERLTAYRVFPDGNGRMNLDINQAQGGILLVPQFTLAADTGRGNRPSLGRAAPSPLATGNDDSLVSSSRFRDRPHLQAPGLKERSEGPRAARTPGGPGASPRRL